MQAANRAKQGHKPGTQTNLELACKFKHCVQDQIKDAETSRARESKRERNRASMLRYCPAAGIGFMCEEDQAKTF